ncbi:MAG TPA: TIGR00282 family metallophosphoesterase [Bdellovibrionota bacterium]|nr:TIGR00282 family metallophosphoesterase [Bdellovibrionota bacterium]
MKILFIGDVFGKPGRRVIEAHLPRLIDEEKLDFVIANGENMAGGKGLTPATCRELFDVGVDVITTGNHVRDQKEIDAMLESDPRLLRPLNYPPTMPGTGHGVRPSRGGASVGVVNAIGRVHMGEIPSPFLPTMERVKTLKEQTPVVVVDIHAEATSEKRAMAWYLDGIASAVVGTHTHVQTADEEILPKGTAYITDVGMTGPYESVIGLRTDLALERFVQQKKGKFEVGKGDVRLCGAIIEIDVATGRALTIRRLRINHTGN